MSQIDKNASNLSSQESEKNAQELSADKNSDMEASIAAWEQRVLDGLRRIATDPAALAEVKKLQS